MCSLIGQTTVSLSLYDQTDNEAPSLLKDTTFWIQSENEIETVLEQMNVPQAGDKQGGEIIIESEYIHAEGPQLLRQRIEHAQAFLGVEIETSTHGGSRILQIIDQPAQEARLKVDDIIIQADLAEIQSSADLLNFVRSHSPGDVVKITFLRRGKKRKTTAVLGGSNIVYYDEIVVGSQIRMQVTIKKSTPITVNTASTGEGFSQYPLLSLNEFQLYPNPNQGRFNLQAELKEKGDATVRIFNYSGQEIYRKTLTPATLHVAEEFNLHSSLSQGVYLLQFVQYEQAITERLVVVD